MRRSRMRRKPRLLHATMGISVLAAPIATAAAAASAQAAQSSSIQARPTARTIAYGERAVVKGRTPASEAGQMVALQFTPIGSSDWRQVASGRVARDGSFRLVAWSTRTGWFRVAPSAQATAARFGLTGSSGGAGASAPERVAVAAAVRVQPRSTDAFGARTVGLWGRLLPAAAWRRVLLQGEQGGRWITLAASRTRRGGWFDLRYRTTGLGPDPLRIRFAGDRANAAVSARAGSITGYQQAVASWYYDGGTTGCGFHAYYGVANVSLPCGTRVDFVYNGRHVQAVVDDRGPYVGGRTWDLNQNTAAALGFGGVATVWSSR